MKKPEPIEDFCYGSDEEMLAWCERENLTPVKNEHGEWDWHAVTLEYLKRKKALEQ